MENVMLECSYVAADAILNITKPAMAIESARGGVFQDTANAMEHVLMDTFRVEEIVAGKTLIETPTEPVAIVVFTKLSNAMENVQVDLQNVQIDAILSTAGIPPTISSVEISVSTNTTNVTENVLKAFHPVETFAASKILPLRIILLVGQVAFLRAHGQSTTINHVEKIVCIGPTLTSTMSVNPMPLHSAYKPARFVVGNVQRIVCSAKINVIKQMKYQDSVKQHQH